MPPSNAFLLHLLTVLVVAIPAWALFSGGRAASIAAIVFSLATIASKLVEMKMNPSQSGIFFLSIDGFMALSFLVIAMVYSHLWIALMMLSVSLLFCIHAYYQINDLQLDRTFALASNLATVVLLVSLAIGVWTSRRRTTEHA
ncbi:hypothetical protein [Phenylobacterium sp.]|uniref:hypothetical protein n=1 Tax=Phenylobacterium sp. TaxID=1871053 RepID=UPI0025D0D388|nr:hypothetical protein [Phenylobacterium sp.]MCA6269736.1 hypothetical protein [Phenylobacterium sp.]